MNPEVFSPDTRHLSAARTALRDMERKIDQLPLLPQVLVRIMRLNASSDDYFQELEKLTKEDPPLTVRLLIVANSASSAPVSPIKTIREAITRIGAVNITKLVASLAVQRVFLPSTSEQLDLWRHSMIVALLCEHLAASTPALGLKKEEAYLVGLLHDIGRFVMFEHASKELQRVDESHWHSPEALIAADKEVFTFTHSELGYLACKHWGLPREIGQVVRVHHADVSMPVSPGGLDAMTLCVQIADRLHLAMFDEHGLRDQSEDDLVTAVTQSCLEPLAACELIDAKKLARNLPDLDARARQMLGSL